MKKSIINVKTKTNGQMFAGTWTKNHRPTIAGVALLLKAYQIQKCTRWDEQFTPETNDQVVEYFGLSAVPFILGQGWSEIEYETRYTSRAQSECGGWRAREAAWYLYQAKVSMS